MCRYRRCSPAACCRHWSRRWASWSWRGGGRGPRTRVAERAPPGRIIVWTFLVHLPGLRRVAVRHPLLRGARHRHRDRGLDPSRCLYRVSGNRCLPAIRLAAHLSAAGGTVALTGRHADLTGIPATATLAWALTQSGFSQWLVSIMAGVPAGRPGSWRLPSWRSSFWAPCWRHPGDFIVRPIAVPVARSMGVHEVHYSIVVILAMGIGLFAPPFSVGLRAVRDWQNIPGRRVVAHLAISFRTRRRVDREAAIPWLSIGFL